RADGSARALPVAPAGDRARRAAALRVGPGGRLRRGRGGGRPAGGEGAAPGPALRPRPPGGGAARVGPDARPREGRPRGPRGGQRGRPARARGSGVAPVARAHQATYENPSALTTAPSTVE